MCMAFFQTTQRQNFWMNILIIRLHDMTILVWSWLQGTYPTSTHLPEVTGEISASMEGAPCYRSFYAPVGRNWLRYSHSNVLSLGFISWASDFKRWASWQSYCSKRQGWCCADQTLPMAWPLVPNSSWCLSSSQALSSFFSELLRGFPKIPSLINMARMVLPC